MSESQVLFQVSELYARSIDLKDNEDDSSVIVKVGYYYAPDYLKSDLRLYRYLTSDIGQIDFIFTVHTKTWPDKDLANYLREGNFYKVATGTVATFNKDTLFKASLKRLGKFHKDIFDLPSFQW